MTVQIRDLYNRLLSVLSSSTYPLQWNNNVVELATSMVNRFTERLWKEGALPLQREKQWIVGFDVHITSHSISVNGVCVGPAKPSRFKKIWSNTVYYK